MILVGCKKFLEIPLPKDRLVSDAVFTDDNSATSAIIGIYSDMMQTRKIHSFNSSLLTGLESDDLFYPATSVPSYVQFQTNGLVSDNTDIGTSWDQLYSYIYDANACMEGLEKSTGVTPIVKNQLLGEAKFIRAFNYFYLVNLFGDVPLITNTNYQSNSVIARSAKADIYKQIVTDLKDAQGLLPAGYATGERVRPNKWTATALLARTYLYNKDWENAAIQASLVISSGVYNPLPALKDVFLKTSNETIWQLMPVNGSYNTFIAALLVTVLKQMIDAESNGLARLYFQG